MHMHMHMHMHVHMHMHMRMHMHLHMHMDLHMHVHMYFVSGADPPYEITEHLTLMRSPPGNSNSLAALRVREESPPRSSSAF